MKKLIYLALLIPAFLYAQEEKGDRKSVKSNEITKGFYGSLTTNQISAFDETINGKITAGMHFSNFHVGVHYITSFCENKTEIDRIAKDIDTELKYSGYGLDVMYEFEIHEKFSIAPFLNTSLMRYEYTKLPLLTQVVLDNTDDNFLNTQIGSKLFFTPNRNFKIGLDIGYNIANGVHLYNTESSDLSGVNLGLTLQFNHFYPKW